MENIKPAEAAFFNSYFMESDLHKKIWHEGNAAFLIRLQRDELIIPLSFQSKLHRHEYSGKYFVKSGEAIREISFPETVRKILGPDNELCGRVFESAENIKTILKLRNTELKRVFESEADFITTEQALYAGHAFHPAPKSRQGFTAIDSKLYSPESASAFPLRWFFVKEEICYEKHSGNFTDFEWLKKLLFSEMPGVKIPDGFVVFPMHPWQASRILSRKDIQSYLKNSLMIEIESLGADWKPTSSLRTLYREDAEYMLKFSMDVKLTNSVRHLLERELDRGLQVHDILMSEEGQKFLTLYPDFKVAFEPVYLAIKDSRNLPIQETFVMGRENILKNNEKNNLMVAFLTQKHPEDGQNYVQKKITSYAEVTGLTKKESAAEWYAAFLNKAIKPFLHAESEFGILLGAHQQNLILTLKDHLPAGAIFRDCHGTGYSPLGRKVFGHLDGVLQEDNGNILSFETGNYLFSYYLIINSVFNVMESIAEKDFYEMNMLIDQTRSFFRTLKDNELKNSACLEYLLTGPELMHKGNFLCSVKAINENTTTDPLSIYVKIQNPFYQDNSHVI